MMQNGQTELHPNPITPAPISSHSSLKKKWSEYISTVMVNREVKSFAMILMPNRCSRYKSGATLDPVLPSSVDCRDWRGKI